MGVVTWAGNYSRVKLKILFQGEFDNTFIKFFCIKAALVWVLIKAYVPQTSHKESLKAQVKSIIFTENLRLI